MSDLAQKRGFALPKIKGNAIVMALYLLFLLLPIYWLLNMSLKTNTEILNSFTLWPRDLTFDNYMTILTDASWYTGYLNSMAYVVMNMVISLAVALPAAYAFSRYSFMGDKHLFFWLLTNRMAPPAVFALPSKLAAIPHGIRPARPTFSKIPMERRSVFRRRSARGPARPSTRRRRCSARARRSLAPRSGSSTPSVSPP